MRGLLYKLKFICKLNNERWKICKNKPGLCRNYYKTKKRFLRRDKKKKYTIYLDIESNYEYFTASGLRCFSQNVYDWISM